MSLPFLLHEEMQDDVSLSLVAAVAAVAATNPAAVPRLVAAVAMLISGETPAGSNHQSSAIQV